VNKINKLNIDLLINAALSAAVLFLWGIYLDRTEPKEKTISVYIVQQNHMAKIKQRC